MAEQDGTIAEYEQAIGHALSQWSGVEIALEDLFRSISGLPNTPATNIKAHVIFATIISFEARCAVVGELMKLADEFSDYEKRVWAKLLERTLRYYKKRHELAHFTFMGWQTGGGGSGFEMVPYFSVGNEFRRKRKTLTLAQIQERGGKFEEIARSVYWHFSAATLRKMRSVKLAPQAPDLLLRLRELVDQSHAEQKPPPRS